MVLGLVLWDLVLDKQRVEDYIDILLVLFEKSINRRDSVLHLLSLIIDL